MRSTISRAVRPRFLPNEPNKYMYITRQRCTCLRAYSDKKKRKKEKERKKKKKKVYEDRRREIVSPNKRILALRDVDA